MNKIKKLTVAGSLVMASSLLVPTVANAQIISSGADCMAANLNQALQGMGWSQAGVKNNATTSFFVVCPLEMWSGSSPTAVAVFATFPASGGTVACTFRTQNVFTGAYTSVSFPITGGVPAALPITRGTVTAPIVLGGLNNTIVCALDPGEGIEFIVMT